MSIELIKELRAKTGAGFAAIKEALDESGGDVEKAIIYLRKKGEAKAEKRVGKDANEGIVAVYKHHNNKLVVVVEINTETDFAAKSEELKKFGDDIAVHIAALDPAYIDIKDIDSEVIEKEKSIFEKELEGKPEDVKEKIIQGKLEKFYNEVVLMKQEFFSDSSKTVEDYLNELIAKVGEKVIIKSFYRFEIGKEVRFCDTRNRE
jgi:elongation factor Ts